MGCDAAEFPRLVDRLFLGELPARRRAVLREHLAVCGACRTYYDRVALLRRAMSPGGAAATLEMGLADEELDGLPGRGAQRALFAGAGSLGLALALLAFAMSPVRRVERAARDEGVRVFCLGSPAEAPVVTAAASGGPASRPGALRCHAGQSIQFAYTETDGGRALRIVGRDARGQVRWYAPGTGEPAIPLDPGAIDRPLDRVRLGADHPPGEVDLLALFAPRSIEPGQVEAAIAQGGLDAAAALSDNPRRIRLEVLP